MPARFIPVMIVITIQLVTEVKNGLCINIGSIGVTNSPASISPVMIVITIQLVIEVTTELNINYYQNIGSFCPYNACILPIFTLPTKSLS